MITAKQFNEIARVGVKTLGFRCKSDPSFTWRGYAVQIKNESGELTPTYLVAWDGVDGAPCVEPAWNVIEAKD